MNVLEVSCKTGRGRQETSDEHPSWRNTLDSPPPPYQEGKAGYRCWPLLKVELLCSKMVFPWWWWCFIKASHLFQLTQNLLVVSCISLKKIPFKYPRRVTPFPSLILSLMYLNWCISVLRNSGANYSTLYFCFTTRWIPSVKTRGCTCIS